MTSFCWLPPESAPAFVPAPARARRTPATSASASLLDPLPVQHPAVRERRGVVGAQDQVVADREAQHQAVLVAVFRDVGDAALDDLARGGAA